MERRRCTEHTPPGHPLTFSVSPPAVIEAEASTSTSPFSHGRGGNDLPCAPAHGPSPRAGDGADPDLGHEEHRHHGTNVLARNRPVGHTHGTGSNVCASTWHGRGARAGRAVAGRQPWARAG